jgi:hypothetical protein
MSDIRADDPVPADDDDRLPWLESVEEDDARDGPSPLKLVAAVLIGLVAIGLVVGGIFWMGDRETSTGAPEVIAAPQGDYKVKPDNPGGMTVEGEGDAAFAASAGEEPQGKLNVGAVPEAPVAKAPTAKEPLPAPTKQGAAPALTPAAGGPTIQLGAFSSQSAANDAWKALSGRFKYLAPLSHSVVPVAVNGRTLYRLRATGPEAANVCARLQVAGENCVPV